MMITINTSILLMSARLFASCYLTLEAVSITLPYLTLYKNGSLRPGALFSSFHIMYDHDVNE